MRKITWKSCSSEDPNSVGLGGELKFCISEKLPGNANAGDPGTHTLASKTNAGWMARKIQDVALR